MKLKTNVIFQVAAFVVQFGNQYAEVVPEKYKHMVALAIGISQALVAYKVHSVNPDGTPAEKPYEPGK